MTNFDVDWWGFLFIGYMAGLHWAAALAVATLVAMLTRHCNIGREFCSIRSSEKPVKPDFNALPGTRDWK